MRLSTAQCVGCACRCLGLLVSWSTFLMIGATSGLTFNVIGHLKLIIVLAGGRCLLWRPDAAQEAGRRLCGARRHRLVLFPGALYQPKSCTPSLKALLSTASPVIDPVQRHCLPSYWVPSACQCCAYHVILQVSKRFGSFV